MIRFEEDFLDDLKAGMWDSLKFLVIVVVIALFALWLCSCATHTISITPGCVNATSTSTIYCPEATVLRVMDGNRTVDMVGESSGVGAVVTGVLKP